MNAYNGYGSRSDHRFTGQLVVVLVTVTSVLEEEWAVAMLEAAETFLLVMT